MSIESFIEEIRKVTSYAPCHSDIEPGKLVRFATSDRQNDKAGWCKLFDDGTGGVFGCWRTGISETWQVPSGRSPEEQAAFLVRVKQAKEEAANMERSVRQDCREKSAYLWDKGRDADAKHPYLLAKSIKPYGIRQLREALLAPVRDSAGTLHGLQFIFPDGSKRFKAGTAVTGCYHAIGQANDRILITEGYATGATLHEVTGYAVACSFTAGNLKPAAEALREKYPETILIVCADDDHATLGNPGLTKAAEAALAVSGLLAVPRFPVTRTEKDTDFNDLARHAGPEAVRECIAAANPPTQASPFESRVPDYPLEAVIERLSKLTPLQYDQVRRLEAKALGVRPTTLDSAVMNARKGPVADDLPFAEVEPWPDEVDAAQLLTEIAATIQRFIVCERETVYTAVLWAAMTWFIDVVQIAPLAIITAPEMRCGKSQLLFLLGRLSARSITTSSISPAALYRTIDAWCPTLLIDEADAFLRDNEELRGIINSGHTRESAYVIRTSGDNFTPTKFRTWGAKALAGIGRVAGTLMDRAVILQLRRKLPHEEVDRIRHAEARLFDDLRSKLARFAEDYRDQVRQAQPPLPQSLNDRAQDNWEPLLAIAMAAGNEWLQLGTAAALKLSNNESTAHTAGTELLYDIREIFGDDRDRITSADLIRLLCADEEKPWASFNRGNAITPRQVAKLLREYGILSHTIRIGIETAKGYTLVQFEEVFFRYLSPALEFSVTPSQDSSHADFPVTDHPLCPMHDTQTIAQTVTCNSATDEECDGVTYKNYESTLNVLNEVDLLELPPS